MFLILLEKIALLSLTVTNKVQIDEIADAIVIGNATGNPRAEQAHFVIHAGVVVEVTEVDCLRKPPNRVLIVIQRKDIGALRIVSLAQEFTEC